MAGLALLLIILGCVAFQYSKGSFVRSFGIFATSIISVIIAFNYFEVLGGVVLSRSDQSSSITPWAQPLAFLLIFIVSFGICQTIAAQLLDKNVKLGTIADKIGRSFLGLFIGLIFGGVILVVLDMSPLSSNLPYERFSKTNINPDNPEKVFLNGDGFVAGWVSLASKGSLSGKKSFAAIHPEFINSSFLNRICFSKTVSITTSANALDVPRKDGVWPAPDDVKNAESPQQPVNVKSGHRLIIVRLGIKKSMLAKIGSFSLSQLRVICKNQSQAESPLTGSSITAFAKGYMQSADLLKTQKLSDIITIKKDDITESTKWIDFVFEVPNGYVPAIVQFKQNFIAELAKMSEPDQAPAITPFQTDTETSPLDSSD
ncbi:MAG: CvpA family protein [Planctomycetes bacterium]|nr:CvpA family protein [Planctomycetota bacterium]MBL7106884.1 CvpA family protein [Phycisphaerae bacterium]